MYIDEARKILRSRYILSPKAHKVTRRAVKKELQKLEETSKSKKERKNIHEKIIALEMLILYNLAVLTLVK